MIVYFLQKDDVDYPPYIKEWVDNYNRMIFLDIGLSKTTQMSSLIQDIQNNPNKDILAIKFPNKNNIHNNHILSYVNNGNGIKYNNGIWYPNEIWIYNPL
jgi:hypothetical protein